MVDLDMNCDETIEGWFDLKAFLAGGKSFFFFVSTYSMLSENNLIYLQGAVGNLISLK